MPYSFVNWVSGSFLATSRISRRSEIHSSVGAVNCRPSLLQCSSQRKAAAHAERRIAIGEQHTRVSCDDAVFTRSNAIAEIVSSPARRIENDLPHRMGDRRGQLEVDLLGTGIAQKQQMPIRCSMRIGESLADEYADGARLLFVPIGGAELMTERMTPAHILVFAIDLTSTLQESVTTQSGRLPSEYQQLTHERREPAATRTQIPIDPTDFVVLAVRIVVAALRATKLIARLQHRHTLRQQYCGEQIANLTFAQLDYLLIFRRAFDATVPTQVVIVAITVVFEIGFVVLFVVGSDVVQREAVVTGDVVHAR